MVACGGHPEACTKPPCRRHVLLSCLPLERDERETAAMTDTDYTHKLDELDRLLNDPDVPMEPARVWSLLAELSHPETSGNGARNGAD